MLRILLSTLLLSIFLYSNALEKKFAKRGAKIAEVFCDLSKLPKSVNLLDDAIEKLKSSKVCGELNEQKLKLVGYYLISNRSSASEAIDVPNGAKCSVCGMFVYKYPKWTALMVVDGKHHFFDGVKDVMKYYFFDADFPYDRSKISKLKVTNYYTLESIDAKSAIYVYDSKVYGPMGRELIPFSTKQEAQNFIKDHGGELMEFSAITPKNVMALDGVEFEQ